MSWSFLAMGKPDAVGRAIEESSNNKLTGNSLEEWNEAKPALLALVGANQGNIVKINAYGSASFELKPMGHDSEGSPTAHERVRVSGSCSCVIESLYGFVE